MKRIISGKTYNTSTASKVASWSNGLGASDFKCCEENLYRTKKGTFFIAGYGGAMSRWSEPVGNMTGAGDGIEVLAEAAALAWCESHDIDAGIIEEWFVIEAG